MACTVDFNIAGWKFQCLPHNPFGQEKCAEPTGVSELWMKGIWKGLVLGISSRLVSPFPSCFSLTIELSCSLEDITSNDLLRKMGTGYNSHHCGIAETLECLTNFPTPWNSLYLNSFEARS